MISSKKSIASAVGGKTARACDSCIRTRARWYCAADDAFLCQACDSSVHSANPLARRHERVRLKIASLKSLNRAHAENLVPSWHRGFTRKARTPRHGKPVIQKVQKIEETLRNPIPLVPEVGSDEISHEENEEEQLLYRVPIFDPFVAELCTSTTISIEAAATLAGNDTETVDANGIESKPIVASYGQDADSLHGFLPSDMDLTEFAADVESLLGQGLENESFGMEELGLMDCKEKEMRPCNLGGVGKVKLEEEEGNADQTETDMVREPFELSFDYDSTTCGEEEEKEVTEKTDIKKNSECEDGGAKKKKRKILLRLDYEAVLTAWAGQGCPWTNGNRPDFSSDDCWPDCTGACGAELHRPFGDMGGIGAHPPMGDGGREAKVSRYREKRRTRLFSKKIRYEVRKLNAEKRPRMKGRFVKRASFAAPAFPLPSK